MLQPFGEAFLTVLSALNHLSDTYSRAWNIGFARNILRALPIELRNMVSKELVQIYKPNLAYDETNRKHTPSYDVGWNASYVPTCHHNERLGPRDYPHYFLKDFMGTEFVTELSENFHSETRFVLDHPYEIKGFLTRDRFFTRCIPLDHVRFMKIVVSLRHFSSITGHIIKWSSPKFDFPLKQHYEAAVRDLAPLKTIPVKRGATIALDVECRSDGGGPKFAEVLFPVVYELKVKGWIVQIKGRYGGRENTMERTAKDFNYNVPRQEWERKARTHSAFVSHALKLAFGSSH
jgi:hypothetical protein